MARVAQKTPFVVAELAERINPSKFNFSPKLVAIVGAIIGFDYGTRDRKGGRLTSVSITSDGYVIAGSTAHESGAFIGTAEEMTANLAFWKSELSAEDRAEFERIYSAKVTDWRN